MNEQYESNNLEIGNYPIKFVALGGLDEMGKNCYVLEVDNDAFIIEAGSKYPSRNIPGIDIIIPDFSYIRNISNRIKGIIITHGHDDQFGALPYLTSITKAPIYASLTTITMIRETYRLEPRKIANCNFVTVDPNDTLVIAGHTFELFQTTHSIPESFGFALKTRFGNIVYTSDFISDYSPLKGYQFNLPKVARLSESDKTFLLLTESEASDKKGIASPMHKITDRIKDIFEDTPGKIYVSLFSQNFFNIQEVINLAIKYKKKVCFANKDQANLFRSMAKIGNLVVPDDLWISPSQLKLYSPKDMVVLVTGSGEKLYNFINDICDGNVENLKVNTVDTWIDAAPSVAGTESIAVETTDNIFRTDCHVLTLSRKDVSSMHAQQEDLKMMISLFRPKYYLPVKGEFRLLMSNAKLAIDLNTGLNHFNTFVLDNGAALAFDESGKNVKKMIQIKSGDVLVDGSSVGDVKQAAIEERTKMADGGVIIFSLAISSLQRKIVSDPDVHMRGFIYMKDTEPLFNLLLTTFMTNVKIMIDQNTKNPNASEMSRKLSEKMSRFIERATNKQPMVIASIFDVDNMDEVEE